MLASVGVGESIAGGTTGESIAGGTTGDDAGAAAGAGASAAAGAGKPFARCACEGVDAPFARYVAGVGDTHTASAGTPLAVTGVGDTCPFACVSIPFVFAFAATEVGESISVTCCCCLHALVPLWKEECVLAALEAAAAAAAAAASADVLLVRGTRRRSIPHILKRHSLP